MTLVGADFSHHNGDLGGKLAHKDFAVLKINEFNITDSVWLNPAMAHVLDEGLLGAGYSFAHRGDGSTAHAVECWRIYLDTLAGVPAVKAHGGVTKLGHALDQECTNVNGNFTPAQGQAFIAAAHADGFRVGLYCVYSMYPVWGQDWRWVVAVPGPPPIPFHVHQYAAVAGYGDLDRALPTLTRDGLGVLWTGAGGDANMPDPRISDEEATALAKLTPFDDQLRGYVEGQQTRLSGGPRPTGAGNTNAYGKAGWDSMEVALTGGPTPPGQHHHETGGVIP